jgi:prevent-host-death family protein
MRTHDLPLSRSTSPKRTFSATEAKNNFGEVLRHAQNEGPVFITKRDRAEAVVLSVKEYEALAGPEPVDLEQLESEFDSLFEQMQTAAFGRGADQVLAMNAHELGQAARKAIANERYD